MVMMDAQSSDDQDSHHSDLGSDCNMAATDVSDKEALLLRQQFDATSSSSFSIPLWTPDEKEPRISSAESFPSINSSLEYPLIDPILQKDLAKEFKSKEQLLKLLRIGFLLWLRTALLLLLLGMTIWGYQRKPVMTQADKNWFNTVMTGLSIALGLNIAAALNEMTLNMRWWFLSRRPRSPMEVDTILKSDVSRLSSYLMTPTPWAASAAILWLLINIASQIGVATLGLTYSIDAETSAVLLSNGTIKAANLTTFFPPLTQEEPSIASAEYTANLFGNMAVLFGKDTIENAPIPDTPLYSVDTNTWLNTTGKYWLYRFTSSPSSDGDYGPPGPASIYNDRYIQATWSCYSYSVEIPSGNGEYNDIIVNWAEGSGRRSNITIPFVQVDKTTFFNSREICGDRCAQVFAFEPDDQSPWYYVCNITLSNVTNVSQDAHKISDIMARMAARSIALGGSWIRLQNDQTQVYQIYPKESTYGQGFNGIVDDMGQNIAQFAIGAISVADTYNPRIKLSGQEPSAGLSLTVPKRSNLIVIFSLIAALQLLLFLATTFAANLVIVTDDSPFAIARLLAPLVSRLGKAGTIRDGREICEVLSREDQMHIVYSVHRYDAKGTRSRLLLGYEAAERAMPNGLYD